MRAQRLLWIARVLLLRARHRGAFSIQGFGLSVGRRVSIQVGPGGRMRLGERLQLRDGCELAALGGELEIAPNVFFNRNCSVVALGRIGIGSDCIFGPNVAIFDHDHSFDDESRPIWAQEPRVEPVTIGENVWVGANTVITRGARIGSRVVVGANSVVTKELLEPGVYAGNPATLVRKL